MSTTTAFASVRVPDWWDIYTLTDGNHLECPDCEEVSPELRDIYAAAKWVDEHYVRCPA